MAEPGTMKSYVVDLTPERDAVVVVINTEEGETLQFKVPIGEGVSQLVGTMIEQSQYAGDHIPKPADGVYNHGYYITYPKTVRIAWKMKEGDASHPVLVLDYGGSAVGCALDVKLARTTFEKMANPPRLKPN